MTSWLPSSIQKRLLRYAINYIGILEDEAIDLDNLDISWGRRSTVEFKNVGLNVERISGLAGLPPNIRLETAKILLLRATLPANLSGISLEVDGIEVVARLEEEQGARQGHSESYARTPGSSQSPSHRKTSRRLRSPPRGSLSEAGIPTAADLARSFLAEEPIEERRELEATVAANARDLEESIASESSEGSGNGTGTGAAPGLPAFLANYLQGIIDCFEASIRNVHIRVQTDNLGDDMATTAVGVALKVQSLHIPPTHTKKEKRELRVEGISIELCADSQMLSELSQIPPPVSPTFSRSTEQSRSSNDHSHKAKSVFEESRSTSSSTYRSFVGDAAGSSEHLASPGLHTSAVTADFDRFADAGDDNVSHLAQSSIHELDIQPGDDNVSWISRRSHSDAPTEDLWAFPAQDDLPDSLLLATGRPLPEARLPQASSHQYESSHRSRRAVSPYDRHFQGPGSWPRLESSPSRHHIRASPGSWPAPDQSQQSFYQPLTPSLGTDQIVATDNKRHALEAFPEIPQHFDMPIVLDTTTDEESTNDMAESRLFSHDEAESIYMSAMTLGDDTQMPGAWGSEPAASERARSPQTGPLPMSHEALAAEASISDEVPQLAQIPQSLKELHSEASTPRAPSPSPVDIPSLPKPSQTVLQLLYIDTVSALIPVPRTDKQVPAQPSESRRTEAPTMSRVGMPGTFSAYSEMTSSRRRGASSSGDGKESVLWSPPRLPDTTEQVPSLDITVGAVSAQVDLSTVQLLYRIGSHLASRSDGSSTNASLGQTGLDQGKAGMPKTLSLQVVQFYIREHIPAGLTQPLGEPGLSLASINCRRLSIEHREGRSDFRLGLFELSVGRSTVLAFDRDPTSMTSSVVFHEDLQVAVNTSRATMQGRPVTEIDIHVRPLVLEIDLGAIDEAFSSFGGLSSVLDIGSSILSEGSPLGSPVTSARPARVRFQDDSASATVSTELKVNARIGGATVKLRGEQSMVILKTSTIKSVYRTHAATISIGHLRLGGPYILRDAEMPVSVDLGTLRLDYLFTPHEQDFERLLALLVPSKDKYDTDDDILIDTLLRQRRKGACLRVTLDDAKAQVINWECLKNLESLTTEVGRLAAVAKYLPEDDRPGLLAMIRVKKFETQLPVNDRFGTLQATLQDFQCAHVGFPALLALSMSNIKVVQMNGPQLVHPLVPLAGVDNLPMVMARMLGDEAEPVVKIKLYNVCVEYNVPTLLDLTGMDRTVDTEEMVAGLATSVADLALGMQATERPSLTDNDKSESVKKTDVKVLLHNSAIGLSPREAPSKGLFILTDAHFATIVPPEDAMKATLELRQAGIVITDDAQTVSGEATTARRNLPENTKVDTRLLNALWGQGYVSVGSIMHAVVDVDVKKGAQDDINTIEVDVRNEFLLLETCADSTQTLIGIINGLAPPTPPSRQPKYLTEPMSLDDMISSFTGDAYAQPQRPSETIFDVDEEPEPDFNAMMNASCLDDAPDDLLAESEMTSSLYGPTSGLIGDLDDDQQDDRDFGEVVESLLEDDPFEMTDSPNDMPFSDTALLKDLRQQSVPAKSNRSVDLGLYEIEDLGFDALGVDQQALGSDHRFNAPTSRGRAGGTRSYEKALPFKLKLRDVNIAWHLHDGYDWQKTRDGLTAVVEQVERRAEERMAKRRQSRNEYEEEESTIGDCMFNSVYITIPANVMDPQDIRRGINRQIDDLASESESVPASGMSRPTTYSAGGRPVRQHHRRRLKLERSRHHKISFEIKGVSADLLVFPPDSGEVQSSIDVRLKHFEIIDLVPSSTWRKFLTEMPGESGAREMSKPMIHLEMLNVRTIAEHAATEIILHVTVKPLRLHVDQDALDFITRFFEFKDSNASEPAPPSEQPFLQRIEVETVDLQLDYKPKKVDYIGLRSGHTSEFMNFVILEQANIRLRHAIIYGLHGFEPLHKTLSDIWTPDVKRNQLPTVLAGLASVRTLVNIGTGVRDVVAIPVREYKKDGRIVRSIQKGTFQFGKTTASELARLGAKVAIGTQNLLSGAEGMLSPAAASSAGNRLSHSPDWADTDPEAEEREPRAFSAYADQPLGVFAGLKSARRHLEHDLLTARDAFIAVQGEILESEGPGSAARAVARHAPTVILRPVIGASRAVGTALLGVGNQIDRGGVRRMEDKYKRR